MLSMIRENSIYQKGVHIKHFFEDNYINKSRVKFDTKIIVVESDDWGSIRVPSKSVYDLLLKSGDNIANDPFLRNDSLESYEDLEMLFDVLCNIKDSTGKNLPITANFAMANADFDFIQANKEYSRRPFYDTYEEYYGNKKVLDLIKQGLKEKIFIPQLHCMEHLNVIKWMQDYKNGKRDVVEAIENRMYGIGNSFADDNFGYMATFDYTDSSERDFLSNSLMLAAQTFKSVFGYDSESFVASCLIWDDFIEKELKRIGINHIQSGFKQILPSYYSNSKHSKTIRRKMFECNYQKQIYTVRNCVLEPSISGKKYSVSRCLEQVESAFRNRVPAILTCHRLNFIGSICEQNRKMGLDVLRVFFEELLKRHPDVVFLSSEQLGAIVQERLKIHNGE